MGSRSIVAVTALALLLCLAGIWLWEPQARSDAPQGQTVAGASVEDASAPALVPAVGEAAEATALQQDAVQAQERAAVPSAALIGRVVDVQREPIAGALVSWTALDARDLEMDPTWRRDDLAAERIDCRMASTREDGYFTFDEPPPGDLAFGSVLWATHTEHTAACLPLGADRAAWPEERTIELAPAIPMVVRVVDSDGAPVANVRIEHGGLVPPRTSAAPGEAHAEAMRALLFRSAETNEEGLATVGPFPGEQTLVAVQGSRRSRPWFGEARPAVELRLGESFQVSGTLALPEWDPTYIGERRIVVAAQTGNVWRRLASLRRVGEGAWGPIALPLLADAARYRLRVEGSPIVPLQVHFEPPASGAHLRFDLAAQMGSVLWFVAFDEQDQTILGSKARVQWKEGEEWNFLERHARPDGYLEVWSVPPCLATVTISADGYETATLDSVQVPPAEPHVSAVTLLRAGVLRGRCLHAGKPVPDFEVIVWPANNRVQRSTHAFEGREDGSFEISDAPPGNVLLTAAAPGLPGTVPVAAFVSPGQSSEVVLELPPPKEVRGLVVDYASSAPIGAATVQLYVSGTTAPMGPWGAPVRVAPDGRFAILGFREGENYYVVSAPGYSSVFASATVDAASDGVDVGEVRLAPRQALEVGLDTAAGVDRTLYRAWVEGVERTSKLAFPPEGPLRFEGLSAAHALVWLRHPDRSEEGVAVSLRPGEPWQVRFAVASRRLTVQVVPHEGSSIPSSAKVRVLSTGEDGLQRWRDAYLPADGRVAFEGFARDEASVLVDDAMGVTLARAEAHFQGAPELLLEVPLGGRDLIVRVVDADGEPLPGTGVEIHEPSGPVVDSATTSAGGECTFRGLPRRPLAAHLFHTTRGTRLDVPLEVDAVEDDEIEFVLDAAAKLLLSVRDGGDALSGVSCQILDRSGSPKSFVFLTGTDGVARQESLAPGEYRVRIWREDCWTVEVDAQAREGGEPVPVELRRLGDLKLEVRSSAGTPVQGVPIELEASDFGADVAAWVAEGRVETGEQGLVTDKKGVVLVRGLPNGLYRWRVTWSGEALEGTSKVPAQQMESAKIFLP